MDYESYMRSSEWLARRDQVLERDGHTCRTCGETQELEVHHASYHHLGDEPLEDLITLCRWCHEAITSSIRERRYAGHEIGLPDTARLTPTSTPSSDQQSEPQLADTTRFTPLVRPQDNEKAEVELRDTQRPTPTR